jgi:hypothetical protein
MKDSELAALLPLRGIPFLKALLQLEERRFNDAQFLKGSTFEEINIDFGIFPPAKAYPVYFAGDITRPKGKKIFVGINPGYSPTDERQPAEQKYLEKIGSFDGYRNIFSDFFAKQQKGLLNYFANIAGFVKGYFGVTERIDWNWLQENFISLDLIPYHSSHASGLRISDPEKFRKTHFEIFLRILEHLNPKDAIFFNGFPTLEPHLKRAAFDGIIEFDKKGGFWIGTIAGSHKFVGLPFLTRVRGGKSDLVKKIKRYQQRQARR